MIYSSSFFKNQKKGSHKSAKEVVPLIIKFTTPKSVVDVGCGIGTWLSVFEELGVQDILGIDGDWVKEELLQIDRENFVSKDLQKPLVLNRKFDLAISLEVAEHLSEDSANLFIKSLTKLSDIVIFSAAIPKQGGTSHLNEQWQSYWAKKFSDKGYLAVDYLRPLIWDNKSVAWWYKQNTLLFVNKKRLRANKLPYVKNIDNNRINLDIVHPDNYLARDITFKMRVKNKLHKIITSL